LTTTASLRIVLPAVDTPDRSSTIHLTDTGNDSMTIRSHRLAAATVFGSALAALPALPAYGAEVPVVVNIDDPGVQTAGAEPLAPLPTRAVSQCGSASSSYKYSTTVLVWTLDVFRHSNTTGACENDAVLTHVYEIDNTCTKYAWGVIHFLNKNYRFGPNQTPGTKSAFGTAECAISVGGQFHGVGVKYTKQSNTRHDFSMHGTSARYTTNHWTTTP
jgi:hypothetical protein